MKRKYLLICSICICASLMVSVIFGGQVFAEENMLDLTPEAKSAILMDMDTGKILFEKNGDEPLPPASITKIMSMLLIMEAVEAGQISWEDTVRTSDRAASMGGSQIFLEVGEEMSVEDMMKGVAIASANDATVALAEHIAGSEELFVEKMNARAEQLGLENTHFVNTNGLPADNHYTSARDIATMSRELLKYEGEITRFTSVYEDYLREETDQPFWLVNTNRLVRFYDGLDGIKTGYTREAKYCLSATAKKGDMRVLAVVMGTPTPKVRNQHISAMLDYAFAQYEIHPIYVQGELLGEVQIDKGEPIATDIVVPHQVSVLTKKGETKDLYTIRMEKVEGLAAPVQYGHTIARLFIEKEGEQEAVIEIPATGDVPRASYWSLLKRTAASIFGVNSSAK